MLPANQKRTFESETLMTGISICDHLITLSHQRD